MLGYQPQDIKMSDVVGNEIKNLEDSPRSSESSEYLDSSSCQEDDMVEEYQERLESRKKGKKLKSILATKDNKSNSDAAVHLAKMFTIQTSKK